MEKHNEPIEEKLKRLSKLDPVSGCQVWIGSKIKKCGTVRILGETTKYAHVLAWEYIHGPPPEGFTIYRTCGNKLCINIQHMILFKHSSGGPEDNIEWLLDRLKKRIIINPITHCWEWQGSKYRRGYGKIQVRARMKAAHRMMWMCAHGDAKELNVLHKCDNPSCINPEHLFLGTQADNVQDKVIKNRAGFKLNPEAVRDIRTSKLSPKELAEKYKVTIGNIHAVLSRKIWKHIE
jgi:hypothetical protein